MGSRRIPPQAIVLRRTPPAKVENPQPCLSGLLNLLRETLLRQVAGHRGGLPPIRPRQQTVRLRSAAI
jgi:hypothetical protein